jgi:hypothetical protein
VVIGLEKWIGTDAHEGAAQSGREFPFYFQVRVVTLVKYRYERAAQKAVRAGPGFHLDAGRRPGRVGQWLRLKREAGRGHQRSCGGQETAARQGSSVISHVDSCDIVDSTMGMGRIKHPVGRRIRGDGIFGVEVQLLARRPRIGPIEGD